MTHAAHPETAVPSPQTSPTLLISELFRSIQGESTYAGRPCAFVRLTGCPLRCTWCDTTYAFHGGQRMSLDAILAAVAEFGLPLVEVTGGEPLAQPNCRHLLTALCDAGHEVLLETSGALDIAPVDPRVVKIVDVKCPGSGEAAANRWNNFESLGPRDELKFVLAGRADYEWARAVIRDRALEGTRPLLVSTVFGALDPADLAAWVLEDQLGVRLQVQLHKILWPNRTMGI